MIDCVTEVPKGLDVHSWWRRANCKGLPAAKVVPKVCGPCKVDRECIWFALTKDDRIDDHGMFIRGGLTGATREAIWYKNRTKPLAAYVEALMKSSLVKENIARIRKQKDSKYK